MGEFLHLPHRETTWPHNMCTLIWAEGYSVIIFKWLNHNIHNHGHVFMSYPQSPFFHEPNGDSSLNNFQQMDLKKFTTKVTNTGSTTNKQKSETTLKNRLLFMYEQVRCKIQQKKKWNIRCTCAVFYISF